MGPSRMPTLSDVCDSAGNALVVVTESRHAATLHSSAIFEVVKAEVITEPNARNSK